MRSVLREGLCGKSNGGKERTKEPGAWEKGFRLSVFIEPAVGSNGVGGAVVFVGLDILSQEVFCGTGPGRTYFPLYSEIRSSEEM